MVVGVFQKMHVLIIMLLHILNISNIIKELILIISGKLDFLKHLLKLILLSIKLSILTIQSFLMQLMIYPDYYVYLWKKYVMILFCLGWWKSEIFFIWVYWYFFLWVKIILRKSLTYFVIFFFEDRSCIFVDVDYRY